MSTNRSFTDSSKHRRNNGLFWGVALILVGLIFLFREFTGYEFVNWWAIFILLPAFAAFASAWYAFQRDQRINESVRGSLGGGLIVFTVALLFLFNFDLSIWWPMLVIVPGLVIFINGFSLPGSHESQRPFVTRIYRPWLAWNGLGVIYLGLGFLSTNLHIFDPSTVIPNWWAIAILIPALGGLITAMILILSGNGFGWIALTNLVTTAIYACVGLVALLGLSWNLLLPIIIIAVGLIMLLGVFRKS